MHSPVGGGVRKSPSPGDSPEKQAHTLLFPPPRGMLTFPNQPWPISFRYRRLCRPRSVDLRSCTILKQETQGLNHCYLSIFLTRLSRTQGAIPSPPAREAPLKWRPHLRAAIKGQCLLGSGVTA